MDARLEDKSKEDLIAEVQELRQIISENETRWKQDRHAGVCLENMYQFVGLLDSEGRLLDANKPALQAGGLTLKEIQGVYFWDTHWFSTSQANMNQLKASFDEVIREKKFIRYEVDVYARQKGAEITTIDFSLLPVLDPQDKNKVVHVVAEGRDIMEKKKAEAEIVRKNQELQELYDKIKELDESKSMFVANISHELRTPLALILGMTEKVLYSEDAKQWDHDNTKSLETVIDNANILLKHVNDLLDISKLEASEMRVHYMNTNVSEFINRLASYFEILAASQQLTFEVQATPSFTAQLDQEKVEKIVLNLLSNAFKFTPQGGMISLTVRKTKNPSAVASRGAFEIVVADSGPGIPADKRELIFERFRQIEGSAIRTHGGTGLGLAIVNEFVHLLEGTIDVGESQWGGAQMTVTLPINAPEGAVIEEPLVREPVKHSPKSIQAAVTGRVKQTLAELTQHLQTVASLSEDTDSDGGLDKFDNSPSTYLNIKRQEPVDSTEEEKPLVLVVEDNQSLNDYLCDLLRSEYRVMSANNGKQGLSKAIKHHPDCILSDVMMPIMSGDQMVREIRSHAELDAVPIMLLTAKADDSTKYNLLQGGVQEYLSKPFKAESRRSSTRLVMPIRSSRRRRDDDEVDDSEEDEQDQSGDEDIDEENGYNREFEDEESDDNLHENKQNDSMDIINAEDDEKGNKDDANANLSKEELFARAVRDTALFNARVHADKYSKSPFYFDPNTRSFQTIYSYRIRGPYDPENRKPVPNGYRPLEASRAQKPTIDTYISQLRQEKNKSGKYFTQLRQLLEQHQDFQLQAYQCYLDYQHAQQTYQKTVMHLNESLSQTRDYEDAPEQIPLWIQSRSEEKNMKAAKQKLIQYQLLIQQLQPKISQVYGILFPGVNPVINANQLTAPNVLPLSAQAAAAGLTPAHLMSSNLRNQLAQMKNLPISRRKGERESLRLGKRGLESDEVSGEESSQPLTKRRKLEVPTCADCDKQKNEEMLECSECGSFHHPSCLGLSKATLRKVLTYKWKCSNCKLCEKCNSSGIEDKLLFCDYCDKAYHTYCLDPPLDNLPEGEWICSECMGEYLKNKEKLRILREKTAARRAAARAKKMAKKKGAAGRSRRKSKKESEEEKESDESEADKDEDEENDEDEDDVSAKISKRDDDKSLTGTEESQDGSEDPETAAKIALNLLSDIAVASVDRSPKKERKSTDASDDDGVVAIKSDKDKEEKKPLSMKVIVRRTFKK